MPIRLVGTVTLAGNGRTIPITAPKVAGVLAALATRPGTVVGQFELIGRVWGSDPPETALNVLYTYITRLRSLLKSVSDARIERASRNSYVLNVPAEDIDVHRIRSLSSEALRLREAGQTAEAAERLRSACLLADGTALHGVPGRWAAAFRQSFARERLGILTERFRTELTLGHHAAVVDELTALAGDEPLAEPLIAQLMVAYYRCGRPADALEVFENLRVQLRDELGADPSQELRQLHVRILEQDPNLAAEPAAEASRAVRPTPAQLPLDTAAFTGRSGELTRLTELADAGHRLATIVGVGGVGKTSLATHWGHANRHRFDDGQIYLNLRGFDHGEPVSPYEALVRLLTALGYDGTDIPEDTDSAAEMYRSATADLALLVILDNARDTRQVRPLLPGSGAFTIVTSRDRLTGLTVRDDAQPIRLSTLDGKESAALLAKLVDDPDSATALRLAELCGNLPLALRIAAARIAEDPTGITGYTENLARHDRLSLLAVDDDTESAVAANLDLSYQNLSSNAQSVFCRIGSLPGEDVAAELANEVSGLSEVETDRAVRQLVSGHLLEQHRSGRYRMHDLVRLYAVARARSELTEVERARLIDEFIAWHHDRAYQDARDEEANIFSAARSLTDHPGVWRLVLPLRNTINAGRHLGPTREAVEIGLRRAQRSDDVLGVFRMTTLLSSLSRMENRPHAAVDLGVKALELSRQLSDRERTIASGNLGVFRFAVGDLRGAAEQLTKAVDLAIHNDNPRSQLIFVKGLTDALISTGDIETARRYLRSVTDIQEDWITESHRSRIKVCASTILIAQGRYAEALAEAEHAMESARRNSDDYMVSWCFSQISECLYRAGWAELAERALVSELDEVHEHGMWAIEPEVLCDHAAILVDLGRYSESIDRLDQAEEQALTFATVAAKAKLTRANAYIGLNRAQAAVGLATEATEAFARMPWPAQQEEALWALADAHTQLGNIAAAHEALAEADAIDAPANNGRRALMRKAIPVDR